MTKINTNEAVKTFLVKASCEVVFYIPITAKNLKDAERRAYKEIQENNTADSNLDTSEYYFEGSFEVQGIRELKESKENDR